MSYQDLPYEDRMQKAMEYALLLVSDDRPGLDIVNELKDVFGFTENEARECYIQMRKKFDDEFDAAIKTRIRYAWVSLIGSTIILVFFAFLGAGLGWFYLLYTFIWGTVLVAVVPFLAKHYREKASKPESGYLFDRERDQKFKLDKKGDDWTIGVPLLFFILALMAFYLFYSRDNILDTNDLYWKYDLVINDKVSLNNTGGKSSHYEMLFMFKGLPNKFRFDENYYNYGKMVITTGSFSIGDTIAIEMKRSDIVNLQNGSRKDFSITNIVINNEKLIDHEYRNKMIEEKNKNSLLLAIAAFIFCLIIVFIWIRYRKGKVDRENFVEVKKKYRHGM